MSPSSSLAQTDLIADAPAPARIQAHTSPTSHSQIMAQVNSTPPIVAAPAENPLQNGRQGSRISINGRTYFAPWVQWGSGPNSASIQTAIVDQALTQTLGLELLNAPTIQQQPIRWFSSPLSLTPILFDQQRFLNVTGLLQQAGGQPQITGDTLFLTLPPAQVTAVQSTPTDRTIVELDRPTPWQQTWQGGDLLLTLEGTPTPDVLQQLSPSLETIARNALQHSPGPQLEINNGQTQLRIPIAQGLFPTVTTQANPPRLVIDASPIPLAARDIAWAHGIRWRQKTVRVGQANFPIVWLAINPRQMGLTIRPIWSDPQTQVGTAPLVSTAKLWQAVAAINGGFFNRNTRLPLGVIRQQGRWVSGPILNRGAIAWNDQGEVRVGRFSLKETLTTASGKQLPILTLNSGYVQAGISRYTPEWGATYTPIIDNEILVGVQNNQVVGYAEGGPAGQTAFPIPPNGYLLALRANKSALPDLPLNSVVTLDSQPNPAEFANFPHILGAGPLLIQNRQIVLDAAAEKFSPAFIQETAVRSAIGRTQSGEIILVAVQSQPTGAEPGLNDMAKIMEQLGAVDALNLDGGSSTTLSLGGWVLNRSPQSTARVHNGIGIFLERK